MKWKRERPQVGDTKDVKRFLWFPQCFSEECRWLEFATIRYRRVQAIDGDGLVFEKWSSYMFVN
jgi:hypothetical protein